MTDFGLMFAGLGRKKFRTALLIFAVFIAFLIYAVLAAFQASLNNVAGAASSNRLVVSNRINFTQPLPVAYANRVAKVEGVDDVSYSMWFGGYYQEQKNFLLAFAVDPESYVRVFKEYKMPESERKAFVASQDSAMVGRALAKQYGWKVGQQIPLSSNVWRRREGGSTWPVVIRAVYDGETAQTPTSSIFVHFKYLDEARSFSKDAIGNIHIVTTSAAINDDVAKKVDALFANSTAETQTVTEAAFNAAFIGQQGNIGLIVLGVTSAAFVTILLIVGNAMAGAIRERTREIAVMKTIGFTSGRIGRMVVGETLLIAFIGGLLGLGAAAWIIAGLRAEPSLTQFFGAASVTPGVMVSAAALMAALGLITGAIPAFNAMRVNVITAFRRA